LPYSWLSNKIEKIERKFL